MATGNQQDIFNKLKIYLAPWFGDDTSILDAVLQAPASMFAYQYQLYLFSKLQTRIKTATGGFLDLIAQDYIGPYFVRRVNEDDESYRRRILANLLPYPPTKAGMIQALTDLTGRVPIIFEPSTDGAFLNQTAFCGHAFYGGDMAYQVFITVYRPFAGNEKAVYAINENAFLNETAFAYNKTDFNGGITDQDIYDLINKVKPEGTVAWVYITN